MLTITIGLWIIPFLITVISFAWAIANSDGGFLGGFFETLIALIISLFAWLVWAILLLLWPMLLLLFK